MKRISKIARYAKTILPLCCLASCSYLDVVPPETEDIKDMMKNEDATLSFVYSCYNSLQWGYTDPIDYRTYESSTDEFVVLPFGIVPVRLLHGISYRRNINLTGIQNTPGRYFMTR